MTDEEKMEQVQCLSQSAVLDIAFQAVRLYAETHPRPLHVTQGQAAELLGITMDALVRMMAAKKVRLNECGHIPIGDIDRMIASRAKHLYQEQPKPQEPPKPPEPPKPIGGANEAGEEAPEQRRIRKRSPNRAMMCIAEVEEIIGVKTSTIYAWMKERSFPKPIKMGRLSQWVRAEVETWVEQQRAKRDAAGDWR